LQRNPLEYTHCVTTKQNLAEQNENGFLGDNVKGRKEGRDLVETTSRSCPVTDVGVALFRGSLLKPVVL
jgi:hypothetical protein